ncbi:MAG: hypothetical protein HYZ36_03065, partial [Pedosphaera parvula]|nr:hypothetical protein [Pedosphaera parvula]
GLGALLAAVAAAGAVILGVGAAVGGFLAGRLGLGSAPPLAVMGVWLGVTLVFLFFWLLGLMTELQRSETIDLQRLMHLPVALGQMFAINYLASHFTLSIVLMAPGMLGLAFGLAFSRGPAMLLLAPLAASMVFMITAWTYCLRGWLAAMMSNPRRRRAIIMGITAVFVILSQLPNLYFKVFNRVNHPPVASSAARHEEAQRRADAHMASRKEIVRKLLLAQRIIPPLWLPAGAHGLAEHRVLPALLGMLGCGMIGGLGLRRAYRATLRFYLGVADAKAALPPVPSQTTAPAALGASVDWLEAQLPGVPEQAAALAFATLRSMLRAPEVKMALGTSFFITLVLGGTVMARTIPGLPDIAKPFIATASVGFPLFM